MRLWRRKPERRTQHEPAVMIDPTASMNYNNGNDSAARGGAPATRLTKLQRRPTTGSGDSEEACCLRVTPLRTAAPLTAAAEGRPLPRAHDENAYLVRLPPNADGASFFVAVLNGQRVRVACPTENNNLGRNRRFWVVPPPPPPTTTQQPQAYQVQIPEGARPGQNFQVWVAQMQQRVTVRCPPNARPGQFVRFQLTIAPFSQPMLYSPQCHHWQPPSWKRQIRASDWKLYWLPNNAADENNKSTMEYYVRQLTVLEGGDPRMRTGYIDLVPVAQGTVNNSQLIVRNQPLLTYYEISRIGSKSFQERHQWFRSSVCQQMMTLEDGRIHLRIRRSQLLSDSVDALMAMGRHDLRSHWDIHILEDDVSLNNTHSARDDMGDWFDLVAREVFGRNSGLFRPLSDTTGELDIHSENRNLPMFRFCGRFMGRSLFDNHHLGCRLAPRLFRHILGWPITPNDTLPLHRRLDRALGESLDDSDLRSLCLSFLQTEEHLLPQLSELLLGIFDVVPEPALMVFHPLELETMLCRIDVEEWRSRTRYGCLFESTGANHPTVQWFWEIVSQEYDSDRLERLLRFVSGYSGIPLHEICNRQRSAGFTIYGVDPKMRLYPVAHTDFLRLDLPTYDSKDTLRKRLQLSLDTFDTIFDID